MRNQGPALVARIRAEMASAGLEPDTREAELLVIAEALQDRIVELEAAIDRHGLTTIGASGLVKLNPAAAEARQTRSALARVLAGIQMDEGTSKNPVKQRAAQTRWRAHNEAKKERA